MEEGSSVVLPTLNSAQQAQEMARAIVEARLAACVQIEAIRSVYCWKGEVQSEPEWRLTIKTRASRYAELERYISEHHSYDTPEIVRMELAGGSREYLAWVAESVENGRAGGG